MSTDQPDPTHDPKGRTFALSGPVAKDDAAHLPLRGDLAHIALAGKYFVPHYAVPASHTIGADGATLRQSASDAADGVAELAAGSTFEVLDVAGGWAWGCVSLDGPVGYLPLTCLVENAG
ncbi:MAG: SH3 domain-containing protein [Novosphingobium sp.]